jgi:hypothetical protein
LAKVGECQLALISRPYGTNVIYIEGKYKYYAKNELANFAVHSTI